MPGKLMIVGDYAVCEPPASLLTFPFPLCCQFMFGYTVSSSLSHLKSLVYNKCHLSWFTTALLIFKILFIYFERDEKGERKRERETWMYEKNFNQLLLAHTPTGDWPTPRHVPDQGLDQRPFASQDGAQPAEPHQSGECSLHL